MPVTQTNKNRKQPRPASQEIRIIYTRYGVAGSTASKVSAIRL